MVAHLAPRLALCSWLAGLMTLVKSSFPGLMFLVTYMNPQLLHGPAELGRHPREAGAGCVPEDPVPVGVQGDGYAATLYQALDSRK